MGSRFRYLVRAIVGLIVLTVAIALAGCGNSTNVDVTSPSGTRCGVTVSGGSTPIPAAGGSGTLTVTTERECAWTARAEASWISLTNAQGQGSATVTYSVQPNPAGIERRGNVAVDEQRVQIVQEPVPCRYELTPSTVELGVDGGTAQVALASPAGCPWTAQRSEQWVSVDPTEGSGAASLRLVFDRNPGLARASTVNVAGATLAVRQLGSVTGEPCRYDVAPTRRVSPAAGDALTVTITTSPPTAACVWTASSEASWISLIESASGSGSGSQRIQVQANTGAARTGNVRVAGQVVTIEQEAAASTACSYTIAPTSRTIGAQGQDVTVDVTTTAGCAWTAAASATWMTVVSGASGSGNGQVRLTVAANTGAARTGTAVIAGRTFSVEQAAATTCSYTIAPTSRTIGAQGQDVTVDVTTTAGCAWTASSNSSWITVASGASGSGNGQVRLTVAANTGATRTGTVVIAGHTFSVQQAAATSCSYTIAPTSRTIGAQGQDVTVDVTTTAGCAWTAASSASWITVASGASGSGNGQVRLTIATNTGGTRTGTAVIAGQTFTVEQAASVPCTYSLKPTFYNAGLGAAEVLIAVSTAATCAWTASSPVTWATIAEGASGSGNGTVRVLVSANGGAPRLATLTIAGQAFALSQAGVCLATIDPISYTAGGGPDNDIRVTVKVNDNCAWTASSPVTWATISEGASGTGNGEVRIRVGPNMGPARSATLTIAGVSFLLTQQAR